MGLRDDTYVLKARLNLHIFFFETYAIKRNKEEALKRGRGIQRQTAVLISTESKKITSDSTHAKKYNKKK
jgi:hypothetical protein